MYPHAVALNRHALNKPGMGLLLEQPGIRLIGVMPSKPATGGSTVCRSTLAGNQSYLGNPVLAIPIGTSLSTVRKKAPPASGACDFATQKVRGSI